MDWNYDINKHYTEEQLRRAEQARLAQEVEDAKHELKPKRPFWRIR